LLTHFDERLEDKQEYRETSRKNGGHGALFKTRIRKEYGHRKFTAQGISG